MASPTVFSAMSSPSYFSPIDQYFGDSIDDMVYRYSSEQGRGTPTVGIYAKDGLWDDDESETYTARPSSSAPSSASNKRRFSVKTGSSKGRSRSGTVTTVEERPWAKMQAMMDSPEMSSPEVKSKEKRSNSRLRGMGRRGELSVDVVCFTPPLPTPSDSSFASPVHPRDDKRRSSWKRGVQKIFRSKSSVALREVTNTASVPPLPKPTHVHDKPLLPSAPPLDERSNGQFDPFASSLDRASPASPRPRVPRNSPSLRDLKNALMPSKLSKAKSSVNLKASSAPPEVSEFKVHKTKSVLFKPVRGERPKAPGSPLLRPNLPYALTQTNSAVQSSSICASQSIPSPVTSPPSAPLPPVPGAVSPKSPVLLPRSRSTTMSLASPPTSSSFFDLYEQLGIWPTAEKTGEPEEMTPEPVENLAETTGAENPGRFPESSSQCSVTNWEAALEAFPLVDAAPVDADASSSSNAAVASSGASSSSHVATTTARISKQSTRMRKGGSAGSSRGSSRERRPKQSEWLESCSESSEDDVPLGKLHPGAKPRKTRRRHGRNPGGGSGWDGEGGVPADVLRRKLERLSLLPLPNPSEPGPSSYPWAAAAGPKSDKVRLPRAEPRTEPPRTETPRIEPSAIVISRSGTTSTHRSRRRAASTASARHGTAADDNMIRAAAVEPMPSRSNPLHVKAFIGELEGRKVTLEVYPETTARDVISAGLRNGDLAESQRGSSWVVVEIFAELGCERLIREYEPLQAVVRGWDAGATYNCFIFQLSTAGTPTFQRAIPNTAPFLGSWVQYETKKGKWSKRWLETRGGQVFLAKNEKNKDESHINTLFFDVYRMTRAYNAPKPFVFVLKRMDPQASFESPDDHVMVFSVDEALAWKLIAAIYDAKSYALQPHLVGRQVQRAPTVSKEPLVSLRQKQGRSAFTGKGLLRM